MTKVITDEQNYYDIAEAIRGKLDVETLYLPSDMADAIESIPTGTELTSEDEGKVVVEDAGSYVLAGQTSMSVSANGTYDTTSNNEVVVSVPSGSATLVQKTITQNGTYDPSNDNADGYSMVTVNVSGGGGEVEPVLPAEYQEVEYVEFDGSSYIDITGREFVPLIYVECDAERTSSSTSEMAAIGSSANDNNYTRLEIYFSNGEAGSYCGRCYGSINCVEDAIYIKAPSSSYANTSAKSSVGVNQKTNFFYASITSDWSYNNNFLVLGAYGSSRTYKLVGRIYKVKIGTTSYYLQDSSQRMKGVSFATTTWLKPCYRKSDNVVGFYDTEAGVFYTNGGSGTLTAGPDV